MVALLRPSTKSVSASSTALAVGGDGGDSVGAELSTTMEGLMKRLCRMLGNASVSSGRGSTCVNHVFRGRGS
jgi:hypothetical protein